LLSLPLLVFLDFDGQTSLKGELLGAVLLTIGHAQTFVLGHLLELANLDFARHKVLLDRKWLSAASCLARDTRIFLRMLIMVITAEITSVVRYGLILGELILFKGVVRVLLNSQLFVGLALLVILYDGQ